MVPLLQRAAIISTAAAAGVMATFTAATAPCYTVFYKKEDTTLMLVQCQFLTNFQNSLTDGFTGKWVVIVITKHPTTSQMCCCTTLWNINNRKQLSETDVVINDKPQRGVAIHLRRGVISDHHWFTVTIIFVVSVGLSVCLRRVFLSRLWSDFDETWT